MSIDALFDKKYSKHYTCANFVKDALLHLTGFDFSDQLKGFLLPVGNIEILAACKNNFELIKCPQNNALVVMRRANNPPHVGVWYNNKVLHLSEFSGVQYQPLEIAALGFTKTRFYLCKKN